MVWSWKGARTKRLQNGAAMIVLLTSNECVFNVNITCEIDIESSDQHEEIWQNELEYKRCYPKNVTIIMFER